MQQLMIMVLKNSNIHQFLIFHLWVKFIRKKKVKKIIIKKVIIINVKLVLIFKFEEEKILGIIKKIENGFKTPPVK